MNRFMSLIPAWGKAAALLLAVTAAATSPALACGLGYGGGMVTATAGLRYG